MGRVLAVQHGERRVVHTGRRTPEDTDTKEPVREGKVEGAHARERPHIAAATHSTDASAQGGQAQACGDDAATRWRAAQLAEAGLKN